MVTCKFAVQQQRSVNRVKKVLEEGQENIDNTITGAREEYLREEQDLDAQFRHDLDELELSMAGVAFECCVCKQGAGKDFTPALYCCTSLCCYRNSLWSIQKRGWRLRRSMLNTLRYVLFSPACPQQCVWNPRYLIDTSRTKHTSN